MDKKALLQKIAVCERERMTNLSDSARKQEISEWFGEDVSYSEAYHYDLLSYYIEDFMRWQEDKDLKELQEYLKTY